MQYFHIVWQIQSRYAINKPIYFQQTLPLKQQKYEIKDNYILHIWDTMSKSYCTRTLSAYNGNYLWGRYSSLVFPLYILLLSLFRFFRKVISTKINRSLCKPTYWLICCSLGRMLQAYDAITDFGMHRKCILYGLSGWRFSDIIRSMVLEKLAPTLSSLI